jgi:hypothetical protein
MAHRYGQGMTVEEIALELKELIENKKNILPGSSQHELDLAAWTYFLKKYEPNGIIELGTGDGAFSNWLEQKVWWFETMDHKLPKVSVRNFSLTNILEDEKYVKKIIYSAPPGIVLYCDNGDKPKEVEMYSKYLGTNDYLAVHDYGIEIKEGDIPTQFKLLYNMGLTAFFANNPHIL